MDFKADIFDQYTPEARRSVFFARARARQLGADTVESVHLLLGIAREDIGFLNRFLNPPVSESTFQSDITNGVSRSGAAPQEISDLPFSTESRRVFVLATEEATRMSLESVGIEHLLLGLLREENSIGALVLRGHGADIVRVRSELAIKPHSPLPTQEQVHPRWRNFARSLRIRLS